jgi:hypothetical protein
VIIFVKFNIFITIQIEGGDFVRKSILSVVLIISLAAFCFVSCGDGSSSKLKIKTEEITRSEDFLEYRYEDSLTWWFPRGRGVEQC